MPELHSNTNGFEHRRIHLLLLEDNPTDARLLEAALKDSQWYQFEIDHYTTLAAFLDAVQQFSDDPNLVLLIDLNLPDSQGLQTYERVYGACPHVATIILSGIEDEELAINAVRNGAQDYLVKGELDSEFLIKLIAHAIERQNLMRIQDANLESALEKSQILAQVLQQQTDGILLCDEDERVSFANQPAAELLNRSDDELIGCPINELIGTARGSRLIISNPQGFERSLEISYINPADSQHSAKMVLLRDVTHIYRMQDQLLRLVNFDAVTGLYNYSIFENQANLSLNQLRHMHMGAALICLDIKRFKRINTALGHNAGDQLLQCVADRLRERIRGGDILARYSGDEFLIFLPAVPNSTVAGEIADKILQAFKSPFHVQGHECLLGASIGVSLFPSDGGSIDTLVSRADTAMLEAKQGGQYSRHIYTPDLTSSSRGRLEIEQELRVSLGAGGFELEYQPKIDIKTGIATGAEALLRWKRHDGTPVSPVDFIPVLEDTGMISQVGEWVLNEACLTMARWQKAGATIKHVAVNVSPIQFDLETLPKSVRAALENANIPASALELEITESLLLTDVESNIRLTQRLRDIGIRTAIDDFGTGFSSLAYLKQFAVDNLKIDQSFVRDLHRNHSDAEIVVATIGLAHNLRLSVTAEGVEEKAQLDFLKSKGCDYYQGYYFSKPRSADGLLSVIKK